MQPEPADIALPESSLDLGFLEGLSGYMLRRAQLRVFENFIQVFAKIDLRPAQFAALSAIFHNPGRSQKDIAAALGIKRPNFVAMMDLFEQRGFAMRQLSDTDRRSHAIRLTKVGERIHAEALKLLERHEAEVLARLDAEERKTLLALLARM